MFLKIAIHLSEQFGLKELKQVNGKTFNPNVFKQFQIALVLINSSASCDHAIYYNFFVMRRIKSWIPITIG